jgi:hypothetical protein
MSINFKRIEVCYTNWGNAEAIRTFIDETYPRHYRLTEASYNRLVWLANNRGDTYHVAFGRRGEERGAWSLTRTELSVQKRTPFFPSQSIIADPETLPYAPAHQCPVEADGNILFA